MQEQIFKSYDIRGIYNEEFNSEDVKLIARAYLQELVKINLKPIHGLQVIIARDMRASSEEISRTFINEIVKYGVEVSDIDLVPIEVLYYICGKNEYDGGVMVTASHNPPKYGGLKMLTQGGRGTISGQKIKELINNLQPLDHYPGKITRIDVWQEYLENLLTYVDLKRIKPLKVVIDTSNGMAALTIPKLFHHLPQVEIMPMFFDLDENFPNHDPNPLAEGAMDKLIAKVKETQADFGAIFDVDADRVFFIDETGKFVRADEILILLAEEVLQVYPGCGIVYNVICSQSVPEIISRLGGRPVRVKVGWKNIKQSLIDNDDVMLGGELSGHYNFRKNYCSDEAFGALLLMLYILSTKNKTLSKLAADNRRYTKGDEINLTVSNIPVILDRFREKYAANLRDELDGLTIEFKHSDGSLDWWFNIRPSNTEPLLRITIETAKQEDFEQRKEEIINLINQANK